MIKKRLKVIGGALLLSLLLISCGEVSTPTEAREELDAFTKVSRHGKLETYKHNDTGCMYLVVHVSSVGVGLTQMFIQDRHGDTVPYCE